MFTTSRMNGNATGTVPSVSLDPFGRVGQPGKKKKQPLLLSHDHGRSKLEGNGRVDRDLLKSVRSLPRLKVDSKIPTHLERYYPDLGDRPRFLNEKQILGRKNQEETTDIQKKQETDLFNDHRNYREQVTNLKTSLGLLKAGFSHVVLDVKTQRLFDECIYRARYLDSVWATHFDRMQHFCRVLYEDFMKDKSNVQKTLAEKIRVLQVEHEMERNRFKTDLMKEMNLSSPKSPQQIFASNAQVTIASAMSQQATIRELGVDNWFDSDGGLGNTMDRCKKCERKRRRAIFENSSIICNESDSSDDEDDAGKPGTGQFLVEMLNDAQKQEVLTVSTPFDIGARLNGFSNDEIFYLSSYLEPNLKAALVQSIFEASKGSVRVEILNLLSKDGKVIKMSADDPEAIDKMLGDLDIEQRHRLLAQLLKYADITGFASQKSRLDFVHALDRFVSGEDQDQENLAEEFPETMGSIKMRASMVEPSAEEIREGAGSELDEEQQQVEEPTMAPKVSIRVNGDSLDIISASAMVDKATDMPENGLRGLRKIDEDDEDNEDQFVKKFKDWLKDTFGADQVGKVRVRNFKRLVNNDPFTVSVQFNEDKTAARRRFFSPKGHPWDKFLLKSKSKKKARDVSNEALHGGIIGEIYAQKIKLDLCLKKSGTRKPLCNVVMDYFTQKYGLKKISNEYTYGIWKRLHSKKGKPSSRVETFAIACGILKSDCYTPLLGDVITEYLHRVFPNTADVQSAFTKEFSLIASNIAEHAVTGLFRVAQLEEESCLSSGAADKGNLQDMGKSSSHFKLKKGKSTKSSATKRVWTMPILFRSTLVEQIKAHGRPACEFNMKGFEGTVLLVNLDDVVQSVLRMFVLKLKVDFEMLQLLFVKFDEDGNGVLSFEEFQQLLHACQPSEKLSQEQTMELWNKVNDFEDDDDDDTITKEGFAAALIQQGIQLNYWNLNDVKQQFDIIVQQTLDQDATEQTK